MRKYTQNISVDVTSGRIAFQAIFILYFLLKNNCVYISIYIHCLHLGKLESHFEKYFSIAPETPSFQMWK